VREPDEHDVMTAREHLACACLMGPEELPR